MQTPVLYRAEGLTPLAAITDDGPLIRTLDQVMLGWRIAPAPPETADAEPAVQIRRTDTGWRCTGETFDEPVTYRDPVATACSLIAALYKAHTYDDRHSLILHTAGVRIGAGLVLLTGHYRAGKTVITTACAAAGLQVFSDDIIMIDPDDPVAQAPGLAIRLRLPLPENLARDTRDFVERWQIAASDRYAYIRPPRDRLAWRGDTAPITGVVSLRRTEGAPAELRRLAASDALSETIRRNFARETLAGTILDTLDAVTGGVPCLGLTYGNAEEAVALMRDVFEGRTPEITDQAPARVYNPKRRNAEPLPGRALIARTPGVSARERSGQAFLTDAEELVIFNLNPTGSAVWRVLEQPATFGELTELFATAFPDRDRDELTADLASLIRDLDAGGLVQIE